MNKYTQALQDIEKDQRKVLCHWGTIRRALKVMAKKADRPSQQPKKRKTYTGAQKLFQKIIKTSKYPEKQLRGCGRDTIIAKERRRIIAAMHEAGYHDDLIAQCLNRERSTIAHQRKKYYSGVDG